MSDTTPGVTLPIDTNSLYEGRVSTYLLDDELDLLAYLSEGMTVRAVAEEGEEYLGTVASILGRSVRLYNLIRLGGPDQ